MPVQVSVHDAWLKLGFKLNKIRVQSMIKETLQDSKFSVVLDSVYGTGFLINQFKIWFALWDKVQSSVSVSVFTLSCKRNHIIIQLI